jgi:hypothetical protein
VVARAASPSFYFIRTDLAVIPSPIGHLEMALDLRDFAINLMSW